MRVGYSRKVGQTKSLHGDLAEIQHVRTSSIPFLVTMICFRYSSAEIGRINPASYGCRDKDAW